jgi:putative membrane protein
VSGLARARLTHFRHSAVSYAARSGAPRRARIARGRGSARACAAARRELLPRPLCGTEVAPLRAQSVAVAALRCLTLGCGASAETTKEEFMRNLILCAALFAAACGGGDKSNAGRSTMPENPPSSETQTTGSVYEQTPPPSTSTNTTMPPQDTGDMSGANQQGTYAGTIGAGSQGSMNLSGASAGGAVNQGQAQTPISSLTDEQILAITAAANNGEIQQAQLVKDRSQNAQVKRFAERMIADHGQLRASEHHLVTRLKVTPQENAMSQQLQSESKNIMDTLRGEKGASFDRDYVDAQVKEHKDLLDMIDNNLLPQAKHPELKAVLQTVHAKVEGHLKMAQDIQKSLGGSP